MTADNRMHVPPSVPVPNPRTRLLLLFLFSLACMVPITMYLDMFPQVQRQGKPPRRSPPRSKLPTRSQWKFSDTPSYCHTLVANPVKLAVCQRNHETQACPDGVISMMSQFFQDYYLYSRHFSHLKRRGVYLDIAANDPKHLSNTYFMDACLGWEGMCVEGNPSYIPKLRNHRNCHIIPTCASDQDGQNVSFILGGGSGGIVDTNKNMDEWKKQGKDFERINLQCTTMSQALKKSEVSKIDYLSLDVEGHELMVLKGFDWDSVVINVMTIEVSDATLPAIEEYLTPRGYVRHTPNLDERTLRTRILYHDAVFLHKSVIFGEPK